MNNLLLILLLILSYFSPYNLKAETNPFEYRGVKLDMSLDEISNLESVSERYMPNPKTDMKCNNAIFYYNTFNKKAYVTKELAGDNKIFKEADDIYFCGQIELFERNRMPNKFRLKGDAYIFNDDVEYKFYRNKLYHLKIKYRYQNKKSHSEFIKNTVGKIEKRFQNIGDAYTQINKASDFGYQRYNKNRKTKIYFFVSKTNKNIYLIMFVNYIQNKKFGFNTSKTYENIELWLYNRKIMEMIDKKPYKVLANKIKIYKEKQISRENKIKNLKKKKERLDKKYNY